MKRLFNRLLCIPLGICIFILGVLSLLEWFLRFLIGLIFLPFGGLVWIVCGSDGACYYYELIDNFVVSDIDEVAEGNQFLCSFFLLKYLVNFLENLEK